MKIQMTEESLSFLKSSSNMVYDGNCNYYYMPYWFMSTEDPMIFEILHFENLPENLKEKVRELRGEEKEKKENDEE